MSRKKTHEEFLEQIKDRLEEYDVLSAYDGATKKIEFKHKSCGTVFSMKPMHFVYGEGCPVCAHKRGGEKLKKTYEQFLQELPARYTGWTFKNYSSIMKPVTAVCPKCGWEHEYASAKPFVAGNAGCRVCAGRSKKTDEDLRQELAKYGWLLIERQHARVVEGSGYRVPQLKVRCLACGAEKTTSLPNIRKYQCSVCSGHYDGTSGEEDEIYNWIKQLCPDAVQSDRTVLRSLGKRGQELDIFVPSKKVAIEYNGRYWHSVQQIMKRGKMSYAEAKKFHYLKSFWAEKAGIRLIHIWDYEWANEKKQKVLKNIILGALGMLPERYYARNTICKHYERGCARWRELNDFFENNNIQGNRGGTHVFTLEDKDGRILMAYKFGRPSGGRAKKLYEYEMVRGASAPGVQVVGGASKLWKHFVDTLHPNSAVYYIDYNYFDGRSVEKLGGKFIVSQPGVKNYWVKTKEVKNREPRRHAEVKRAIENNEVLEMWNAGTKTYAFQF